MKKHGKIISIPVKEVTEGMQVMCYNPDLFKKVDRVGKVRSVLEEFFTGKIEVNCNGEIYLIHPKELRMLAVEYDVDRYDGADQYAFTTTNEIALKNSQWQKAIDNGEVDSGKIVEFEIVKQAYTNGDEKVQYAIEKGDYVVEYAKIIPNRIEKKMYSEEDMHKCFEAGKLWGETYTSWFTPTKEEHKRKREEFIESLN